MSVPPVFHRHADEYLSVQEWGNLLRADERIARVLGTAALPDARHLLPPLRDNPVIPPAPGSGVLPGVDFAVDLRPPAPRTVAQVYPLWGPEVRTALLFPRVFVAVPSRDGQGARDLPLDDAPDGARVLGVTLAWSLPDLLSAGDARMMADDLRRYVADAGQFAYRANWTLTVREDPVAAARRGVGLYAVARKTGTTAGLRLAPVSGWFLSRDVWRTVYSLGLVWDNMDLFHWYGGAAVSQFRVLSTGNPAYFLPERAVEGERVPGLTLEFDLPRAPDPVVVLDRMAIALSYLRETLGGRPLTVDGAELDGDRLEEQRALLENAVETLKQAGIAPGSPAALRVF